MIAALEEKIQSLYEAEDPRWRCLLSSWLVAFGVLRHKHIMRARPVKITPSTFPLRPTQVCERLGMGLGAIPRLLGAQKGAGEGRAVLRCEGHRIHVAVREHPQPGSFRALGAEHGGLVVILLEEGRTNGSSNELEMCSLTGRIAVRSRRRPPCPSTTVQLGMSTR